MRIALFHNVPSGGAKRAIYEWTKRLVASHSIDVYTLSGADHEFCDIRPFVHRYQVVDYTPRREFESPWGRLNQLQRWRSLEDLTDIGHRIAGQIDADDYDVVFAHTCQYTHAPIFLQFVRTPTVYYLHEPFGRHFVRPIQRDYLNGAGWRGKVDRFDPLIRLYQSRLINIQDESVRRTTLLLANSRFTQEQMRSLFGVNAPVCHLGIDHEMFRPLPSIEKQNSVLSVGELRPRKGFDFIVTSIGQIPEDRRPALKLACNMINVDEKGYVQKLASSYGVELEVMEGLDTEAMVVEYNRAKLCVYAPIMEPLGLVPLEAMSCGTPVVGVAEGGVLETVIDGENGRLVDRDAECFAKSVQKLLDEPGLRRQLGRQARDHVLKNWTWDQATAELESHLNMSVGNDSIEKRDQ